MKRYLRLTSIWLAFFIILPLSSCFSGRGKLFGDITDLPDSPDVVGSGYDTTELIDGIELTLSADRTYYYVSDGSECTSRVSAIPASVNGIPVEAIYKFGTNNKVETLLIPESINRIYSYAFDNCPNLKYTEYGNAKYLGNMGNE